MRNLIRLLLVIPLLISCSPAAPGTQTTAEPSSSIDEKTPTPGTMPCTVVNVPAPEDATFTSLAQQGLHFAGPENAPITIVIYTDFQCETCAKAAASLKQLIQAHPDVHLALFYWPLSEHDKAVLAIQTAEAADLQGKFWEMHDLLFEKQAEWSGLAPVEFTAWADHQAGGLGMDAAQFRTDFQAETVTARAQQAVQFASGIQPPDWLPLLLVNNLSRYSGPIDFSDLDQVIRMTLLEKRQFTTCPPWVIDPLRQYIATLETAHGKVVIQLFADKAPLAVNNFVFLARNGWFDNITWQRVIPGFLAETGDPSGTGYGNPGYYFHSEAAPGLLFDRAGLVGMDNTGADTNGSQFFITYGPTPQLVGQRTIFGEVLTGMDVLSQLTPRPDSQPGVILPPGDPLIRVTIEER